MNWLMRRAAFLPRNNGGSDSGSSELRYRIGIVADVHSGYSQYNYEAHFPAALQNLYNRGAEYIVSCGDQANGESNWPGYISVIEESPFTRDQVYESIGNHEYDGFTAFSDAWTLFRQYARNGKLSGGTGVPYYSEFIGGDYFIFLQIEANYPNNYDCFSTAQLDWLQSELDEHYDKGYNVWLIEHAPFYGWGAGDIISSPLYPRAMDMSFAGHQRLKSIIEAHPNIIMCHGHTHIRFEDIASGVTVYAPKGSQGGCHQFHVPSITALKYVSGTSLSVDTSVGASQCWFCEVYTDKIVMQGINAYTGEDIAGIVYTITL